MTTLDYSRIVLAVNLALLLMLSGSTWMHWQAYEHRNLLFEKVATQAARIDSAERMLDMYKRCQLSRLEAQQCQ